MGVTLGWATWAKPLTIFNVFIESPSKPRGQQGVQGVRPQDTGGPLPFFHFLSHLAQALRGLCSAWRSWGLVWAGVGL